MGGADVCKLWRDESNRPLNCGGQKVGKLQQPITASSVAAAENLYCRGIGAAVNGPNMLDKPTQNKRSTNMYENKLHAIVAQSENKRRQNIFKNTDAPKMPITAPGMSFWAAGNR